MADNLLQSVPNTRNPFSYAKVEQVARDITSSWLTLSEIKQQINLFEDSSQDVYLSSLEIATRMAIEDYLGASFASITYNVYYAGDLSVTPYYLDLPAITEGSAGIFINSVQIYTTDGLQLVQTTNYTYDITGNRIILNNVPNIDTTIAYPIVVNYTQNPSIVSTYPVVVQAGLMLFTHLYNNRSTTSDGGSGGLMLREIPFGVATLLRPYKPLVM